MPAAEIRAQSGDCCCCSYTNIQEGGWQVSAAERLRDEDADVGLFAWCSFPPTGCSIADSGAVLGSPQRPTNFVQMHLAEVKFARMHMQSFHLHGKTNGSIKQMSLIVEAPPKAAVGKHF